MPVKTSTTSLIALGLASFAAGVLVSRRRCQSCRTVSNVRKWGRLYLSVKPTEEFDDNAALDLEVKKITAQVQANHVDKYGYQGKFRLGYVIEKIVIEGKRIIAVQYYTVKLSEEKDNYNKSTYGADSSAQGGGAPRPAPRAMAMEEGLDDTGHTPPPCPRPRPNYTSKYDFEGWECSYY